MKTILTIVMVLGMTAVYEPDSIIPKYFIDKNPQGEYRVYDSKQIVVPKYIVKPDRWGNGYRVYETGKPVQWLSSVRDRETSVAALSN
jgi:hypothetical protein